MADNNKKQNENEKEIPPTKEELAAAKNIIENLIKKDKGNMIALSTVSSVLNSADSFTGKLSAKSLYLLSGNAIAGGLSETNGNAEEMLQWLVRERITQRTDVIMHKDFDRRTRNERNGVNPEHTAQYAETLSNSAAAYLFQKGKMIKAYASAAIGLCLTCAALAANPPVAAAVIGGSIVASVPLFMMNKRLTEHKVRLKNKIDEKLKIVKSFNYQMYRNSGMTESVNAQEDSYRRLASRQKRTMQHGKTFVRKIIKYGAAMATWKTVCVAGVIATSATIGLPLATTVLATAGAASTLAASNNLLAGYFGKKEYIATFAMTYKKFKSKYKDFQFGNEKTNPKDNILQLDRIAYRHRINSGQNAGGRQNTDLFKSDETITFKPGISLLSGASGAGKSTLTELLMHADNVTGGSIKIGSLDKDGNLVGKDYCNLAMGAPCQNIAISYQRPELTECSIDTYIKLGNPNADPKKVAEIKKLLGIGIENGGNRDSSQILTPGINISGGELSRIGLAQALIKDSPIMILDEPTSSVDEKMSVAIVDYIKSLKDKTIIYITHKPHEIDTIGAYQAVDIGKHSETDEISTIKSYDLTNPQTKKDFIKFFSEREIEEKAKQEEQKQDSLDKVHQRMKDLAEKSTNEQIGNNEPISEPDLHAIKNTNNSEQSVQTQASLDKVHQRMKDLVEKRMHERITNGEPISASELQAVKKIKGIAPNEAKAQTETLFNKIRTVSGAESR